MDFTRVGLVLWHLNRMERNVKLYKARFVPNHVPLYFHTGVTGMIEEQCIYSKNLSTE